LPFVDQSRSNVAPIRVDNLGSDRFGLVVRGFFEAASVRERWLIRSLPSTRGNLANAMISSVGPRLIG
jgi:hypothetical protein